MADNVDSAVVAGFGDEWTRFSQEGRSEADLRAIFDRYFAVFPWDRIPMDAAGVDIGCGSGRWARFVAPRCGRLVCVDPSPAALGVARQNLQQFPHVELTEASAGSLPFPAATFDFGYSLGVLHHTPDPAVGMRDAVRVLKPGAPFLVYLYYALDNRPLWFRLLFRVTNGVRMGVSRLPHGARYAVSQLLALFVYWPLARTARLLERLGRNADRVPLSGYRDKPFYVMRTDALDRFGTRIEFRFTRQQVIELMHDAGLADVEVSPTAPYWCAVGFKPAHA
ncbi:MAG: class I SAM-dependent methyltransferase [Actinomycetota bacterium]